MICRWMNVFERFVVWRYRHAAMAFADAMSLFPEAELVDIDQRLSLWAFWERWYAWLGFEPMSLDDLLIRTEDGSLPVDRIGELRQDTSTPSRLHAEVYLRKYPEGLASMTTKEGQILDGTPTLFFHPPSTIND